MPDCGYCHNPAPLVTGREVYPHRPDLYAKQFYACLPCKAWVGCHPGTTKPLGRVANAELRGLKSAAHAAFDPLWRDGKAKRGSMYGWLAAQLGVEKHRCHIGYFNEDECRRVIAVCSGDLSTTQPETPAKTGVSEA